MVLIFRKDAMLNFSQRTALAQCAWAMGLASLGIPAMAADTAPIAPAAPAATVKAAPVDAMTQARESIAAKQWSKAAGQLQQVLQKEPNNADAHNLLAFSYRKNTPADLPKAFDHYKKALAIDPKHKGAHEYIGEAYLMDKQPAEADKHLAALEKICGNTSCEEYQDLAKAIAAYRAK
jgi:Tfp pilus assembly protein PilF